MHSRARALESQSVLAKCFQLLAASDEADVDPTMREQCPNRTADSACPHHDDPHALAPSLLKDELNTTKRDGPAKPAHRASNRR
jgi:hypothetical protein